MASAASKISTPEQVRVADLKDVDGPGPHGVSAAGVDLVVLRTSAGLRVFQGRCPHQGALLSEGELDGESLICRNHRWRFDVSTGARRGGGACLVACPAVERAGELWVDLSPMRRADGANANPAREPPRARDTLRQPGDLPGPRGLPLVGSALHLELEKLHLILEGWAARYGVIYAFRLGRRRSVVVSDPALTESILRSRPETYRRVSKVQAVFAELGVDGVFSAEGAAWRAQRRLVMEALSQRHLRGFYPTLHAVAARLLGRWRAAAEQGRPVDMVEDLKRFTVDVTTLLTFGHDMNTIEHVGDDDDVIQRRLELLFPAFTRRVFALWPSWRWFRLPRDRRLDDTVIELRDWMAGLVREARARLHRDGGPGADLAPASERRPANFLEAMLSARDESGHPFSDATIFANLMTMLLAGEDTTASTLAWSIHELCESPASVSALRSELDRALGVEGAALPRDIDVATELPYVGAVANEAMRRRPVAPLIFFESLVDTRLGDVHIAAGTPVAVLTRPPARDPKRFADPERFRPERWVAVAPEGAHDAAAHIPFGSGPRICPGRSLALLEMKVVLAMLYQNFDVHRHGSPAAAVREIFAFTMAPSHLMVKLTPRRPPGRVDEVFNDGRPC